MTVSARKARVQLSSGSSGHVIVLPGEVITTSQGFLRGHGTYTVEASEGETELVASVSGAVERVNKLISVRPIRSRYSGEVGDLIVGRITEVGSKRWKVDINAQQDATLMLSSVTLPGAQQRIRTYEDQLQMRTFFQESDLISAEVQSMHNDGQVALHTRSLKFGKLENGQLITVPAILIRRLKHHFVTLPCNVDVILGTNGYVWITRSIPSEWSETNFDVEASAPLAEHLQKIRKKHSETLIEGEDRLIIARVRNSINALSQTLTIISPDTIMDVYNISIAIGLHPKEMLSHDAILKVTETVRGITDSLMDENP